MKLEDIKKNRLASYQRVFLNDSTFSRVRMRYSQLRSSHSVLFILAYFAWRSLVNIKRRFSQYLSRARVSINFDSISDLMRSNQRMKEHSENSKHTFVYAIYIQGGVGDALIVARFVRDLQAYLNDEFRFDIFFRSPKLVEPFFSNIQGFRKAIDIVLFGDFFNIYMFAIKGCQYFSLVREYIKKNELLASDTKILDVFSSLERAKQNYELYLRSEPSLDGAFADLLAPKGYKRYSYQQEMFGIPYLGHRLNINTDNKFIESLGLSAGQYVTIHDGWDETFKISTSRPTKAIPSKLWSELVVALKSKFPALKIVQIGGKTGDDVSGVDFNFKNKLSFEQSTSVLAGARLHFDGESGLVHLAASLGVRSVVMFGPTSKEWFGYPENINVTSGQCGNCWWSTDTWMSKCPVGYKIQICTESFNVQAVMKQVVDELNREVKLDSIELQG